MPYYAQINENGLCTAITQTSGVIEDSGVIEIPDYALSYIGKTYADGVWIATEPPTYVEDPRVWWIDVGPFYDRFGMDAVAISASDNGACKAVQTLTSVRKYVNLKDPKVAAMIDMLIATSQPAAVAYAPGSGPMTLAKKNAILNTPTTEYERHVKNLPGV